MGSSSSKQNAAPTSSSPSVSPSVSPSPSFVRRTRSYRRRVFQSPCLRSRGNAVPQVSDIESKRHRAGHPCTEEVTSDSSEVKREHCRELKVQPPEELNSEVLDAENDELDHPRGGCMSSRVFSSRGLNPSCRFLSRLSIFPGNTSFRLNRANSFGSTRPCYASSTRFPMTNTEEEPSTSGITSGNDSAHSCDFFPTCFATQSAVSPHVELATGNFLPNTTGQGAVRDRVHPGDGSGENSFSANNSSSDFFEERLPNRRNAVGETVEQNVRFSRSLSVGRLRERVLRRSSFLDLAFGPSEQGQEAVYPSHVGEGRTRSTSTVENTVISPTSSSQGGPAMSSFIYGRQRSDAGTPRSRDARYHDLLEYRSNFLERRRRIRSQVRALQRLGSRFENLSGHERSCVMSGQHRRGHCTCRINPRQINSNDETSARASISRIVMLAEALFEVLDEIHQQSVVLTSRSSTSSLGSAPAPNEIVESLPLRLYSKLQKHIQDEVAQCYICLVEYEEGDCVRILPCHHEYHKTCIDKWLKEIHRVCPLCRGDVCGSDSLSVTH